MLPIPPHFFGLAQRNGVEPQRKALLGGGAPVRFRDPPASPTRVGGATRPLRCPLRGRIESLAATARGLGWQKSSPVKVFCPAFLQKSGRGPGAEPLAARRSARNAPYAHKAQEGVKGGTLAGGSPFAGGPRRPQPVRFTDARSHPTPGGGGTPPLRGDWRNVVRSAVDEGKGRRGRRPLRVLAGRAVCRVIYCKIIPRPGGRTVVRLAETIAAGRRGRRPLQGGCASIRPQSFHPVGGVPDTRAEKQNKTAGRLTGCFLRLRAASAHLVEALV